MYPALAAIVVLLNVGWRMISKWIVIAGVSATLLLAILSPILLIRQAYALPRFLTAQQMADRAGASAIGWRFDHIAELFSVTLDKDSALEGEVIKVETCWVTINSTEQDLDILVHIVGPENRVVAGRHTYPGLGSYPTSIWQPEKRFCDAIHLDIPEDLDQTLLYKVEVGLVDNKTDERLPAYSSDGALLSHTFAQEVRLEAIKTIELAQNPEGQGAIRLVDAQFDPIWTRNDTNDLNLRWWVADKLDRDYSVFVHIRDPATGRIVAQGDGPPAGGWYPTSVWRIGEVIDDLHTVSIPPGLEGSEYELVVGWYDLESGIRLGEEYHIDTIEVAQ